MSDSLHRNRTLWLCTALHGFTHLYQVALIPLYLSIQKDFGLKNEGEATFLVSALSIAYFLPSYPMGVLSDKVSRKKLLALGLFINAIAFIALAYAPNYGTAIACVILAGLGGSFYHPSATALVARLFPESPGKALGKVGIGAGVGFFIGPIYAGFRAGMTNDPSGWRAPILELGICGLVAGALFMLLAKEHAAPAEHLSSKGEKIPRRLFASPVILLFFLAASVAFCFRDFAGSGMATLGSLFLQHAHGFDVTRTGLTLSCLYLAAIISNPLFGHLSDRGRIPWTSFVLIVAAIAIFIFPRVPSSYVIPVLAVYGFFFMASFPMIEAFLMESVHDSVRGRVFGLFITVGGLIGNLSHWVVGLLVTNLRERADSPENYFGIFTAFAIFVLISLSGLACLQALRKRAASPTGGER